MYRRDVELGEPTLVGRGLELGELMVGLHAAIKGGGASILVSGEPGIGKSKLVAEVVRAAEGMNVRVLSGAAASGSMQPFQVFSKAFGREVLGDLERVSFEQAMAADRTGALLAKHGSEENLGAFAGMLSAVQSFIKDSFAGSDGALGRLEYGEYRILVEHEENLFLAAMFRGNEHPDMRRKLKASAQRIERTFSLVIEAGGDDADVAPMVHELESLASEKFLVRRDFGGLKFESERLKVADGILDSLNKAAGGGSLLVLLEDLHWADESSLFALVHIARNLVGKKILLIGTFRPGESEEMELASERIREEGTVKAIHLAKMGAEDVAKLAIGIYEPNDFPSEFLGRLADQCSGNPLFVIETLRQMGSEGGIGRKGECFSLLKEDYSVPASVEGIVERRLESLEPDAMAMAEYASCAGREFETGAAKSLKSMVDPEAALDKLRTSGIVGVTNGKAEFAHALFQDIVYKSIDARWKSAYHKSLGEHYESVSGAGAEEHAYELARHFSKTSEHSKAFAYCSMAGEKAESVFAASEALRFYGDALRFASKIPAGAGDAEAGIHERLADIRNLVGEFEAALVDYAKALEKTSSDPRKADIHRRIAEVHIKMGESQKGSDEYEMGIALIGDEECVERARLLLVQGTNHSKVGDYGKAGAYFEEGMRVAGKLGMEKEIALANHNIGVSDWQRGEYDAAEEHLTEAIAIRKRISDVPGLAESTLNLGTVHHLKGDLDKALVFKNEGLAIYTKLGDKTGIAKALNNIGIAFDDKGDIDKSLEYYEKSLAIRKQIGDVHGQATGYHNLGVAYNGKGDMEKAIAYFEKALEANRRIGSKHGMAYDYCSLAEAHFAVGEDEKGAQGARSGLELSVEIGAKSEEGWARRNVARGLWRAARWDEAKMELDKALVIFEEAGETEEILKTFYELGNYWRDKGDPGAAKKHYDKALEEFDKLGLIKNATMVREALAQLE
ncbi:MAG: tetratricopeptide repeat protein [Methanobacteriota archaeon]